MSELLPSRQVKEIRSGLLEYLATTFALTDGDAQTALKDFLEEWSGRDYDVRSSLGSG